MFAARYFAARYFAARYFDEGAGHAPTPPPAPAATIFDATYVSVVRSLL